MSELDPRLPQWWSPAIDASWQRARAAAISHWILHGGREGSSATRDASIDERALAFGHGGRSAFSTCTIWETAGPRLQADWIRLGNVGPAAWDKVADIVRHEWARAAGPGGDAAPATLRDMAHP